MLIAGTDGSESSIEALRAGLAIVAPDDVLLVTVVDHGDESLVSGTGMAGGVMTDVEFDAMEKDRLGEAEALVASAAAALGLESAETLVFRGDPARALCDLATDRNARAVLLGTRGRGGVKRALLGSVSDHVVRNAPCPVVITRPPD
jgi:nucleotide-binding universal stress UspA family protein